LARAQCRLTDAVYGFDDQSVGAKELCLCKGETPISLARRPTKSNCAQGPGECCANVCSLGQKDLKTAHDGPILPHLGIIRSSCGPPHYPCDMCAKVGTAGLVLKSQGLQLDAVWHSIRLNIDSQKLGCFSLRLDGTGVSTSRINENPTMGIICNRVRGNISAAIILPRYTLVRCTQVPLGRGAGNARAYIPICSFIYLCLERCAGDIPR